MEDPSKFTINESKTSMANCFDIVLCDENHTVGKIVEYCFFSSLYENAKQLHFCGFTQYHPHDPNCIVRVAYKRPISLSDMKTDFFKCMSNAVQVISEMTKPFKDYQPHL
jgi:DNA-directed RNA polymerase subunit L